MAAGMTLQGGNFNGSMIYVDPGASLRVQAIALNGNTTTGLSGGAFYNNRHARSGPGGYHRHERRRRIWWRDLQRWPAHPDPERAYLQVHAGYGGAIRAGAGSVQLENSTIAFNYASAASPLAGNGIYLRPRCGRATHGSQRHNRLQRLFGRRRQASSSMAAH